MRSLGCRQTLREYSFLGGQSRSPKSPFVLVWSWRGWGPRSHCDLGHGELGLGECFCRFLQLQELLFSCSINCRLQRSCHSQRATERSVPPISLLTVVPCPAAFSWSGEQERWRCTGLGLCSHTFSWSHFAQGCPVWAFPTAPSPLWDGRAGPQCPHRPPAGPGYQLIIGVIISLFSFSLKLRACLP